MTQQPSPQSLAAIRQHLHANPELGWKETQTSAFLQAQLRQLGLEPCMLTDTGFVADLRPPHVDSSLPLVAVRADMDALPIHEETGLSYASTQDGCMHACGHDGHCTMAIGAAQLLVAQQDRLSHGVRFIFQPAEELATGSKAMIAAGALDNVQCIFGGHLDNRYPSGHLIIHDGCVNASTDTVIITVAGKAGHAARPHLCADATVAAAAVVTGLQTLVSREVDPADAAVITVGKLTSGTAYNVVSARAVLEGTLRCIQMETRVMLKDRIVVMAQGIARSYNTTATVDFTDSVPPVINSSSLIPLAMAAAHATVGKTKVMPLPKANMGAEDFGNYLEHVPGVFVRYGAAIEGRIVGGAHTSTWDFNEEALMIGAAYLAEVVTRFKVDI